jgi:hypothetical protein
LPDISRVVLWFGSFAEVVVESDEFEGEVNVSATITDGLRYRNCSTDHCGVFPHRDQRRSRQQ